ncbi:hypothetical protein ABID26_004689 [Mesorhizobium shonense]|uniref:Uncharacterized protein n=1 Tax=Mesorhizobium shonense TaxID=1209948 RepID=A0ABV2HYV3_9HYPH
MASGYDDAIGEVPVGRVDACPDGQCLEEAEERPKLMFHDEGMTFSASSRRKDNWLSFKRRWLQQTEEMLEQSSVAAFERRRADHQDSGARQLFDDVSGRWIKVAKPLGVRKGRAEILDIESSRSCADLLGDLPDYLVDK